MDGPRMGVGPAHCTGIRRGVFLHMRKTHEYEFSYSGTQGCIDEIAREEYIRLGEKRRRSRPEEYSGEMDDTINTLACVSESGRFTEVGTDNTRRGAGGEIGRQFGSMNEES